MNVLKKIVSDNRSTEHFDKVIDILMSTGLSEIDAIKLFDMAVSRFQMMMKLRNLIIFMR